MAFWAKTTSNINNPKELVDTIKNSTRPITVAIGGGGHRLAVEYLAESLGIPSSRITVIMYKGPAQALLDVMGGHVEFGVTPVAVGWPHVQSGKLKVIGIANEYPLKGLEHVPLMKTVAPGLFIHLSLIHI